ncbi:STM4015 family protein [Yinghuangia sp. YIM S09857]|uniref:STM4015 family protein n=1 Tax=Yinghuangia sp. YIM S09857 TaxID=3436929 RepID=UPI003F531499
MGIHNYLEHFGGLPVADLRHSSSSESSAVPGTQPPERYRRTTPPYGISPGEYAPDAVAWRLRSRVWDDDPELTEIYEYFLDTVDTSKVTALIVGAWDEDMSEENPLVGRLARDAHRFPALRHLFVGDVVQEESEISWMTLGPVTPLLEAYPLMTELGVRGVENAPAESPAFTPMRHEHLRRLRIESGGLAARIVRAVGLSDLPALEELELWLGAAEYGGDASVDDLADLLTGARVPALRHLGLMNSEFQDEIAEALAGAPVTARLESLDLSMGMLGDRGAEALLTGQPLGHLRELRIRHHFVSDAMTERLRAALRAAGVTSNVSPTGDPRNWGDGRYIEVSE